MVYASDLKSDGINSHEGSSPSPRTIIKLLMKFRYKYNGYGQLSCNSCGAKAEEDYDEFKGSITKKLEECSKTCPFQIAENYLERISDKD